jgi:hypothetical protein
MSASHSRLVNANPFVLAPSTRLRTVVSPRQRNLLVVIGHLNNTAEVIQKLVRRLGSAQKTVVLEFAGVKGSAVVVQEQVRASTHGIRECKLGSGPRTSKTTRRGGREFDWIRAAPGISLTSPSSGADHDSCHVRNATLVNDDYMLKAVDKRSTQRGLSASLRSPART